MIAMKKTEIPAQAAPFGSHKPLVDALPQLDALRTRLELDVRHAESALEARPEPGVHHSLHDVTERKRLALGGLGMCLPTVLLLLESDPADAGARKALALLSEHGTSEEVRLAARILLDKCPGPEASPACGVMI